MKRKHKILITLLAVAVTVSLTTVPAFALTESEVQDQVNAVGKEVVTGNLFVWFLCAIAFLKVSQKIDSFMSSLGINVGHTGGSMLAEAMIAMRGIGTARTFAGRGGSGGSSSGSGGGNTFMKGGLSGVVSRKVTNTAINNANGSKSGGLGGMAFNSSLSKGGGFANSVIGKIATGNISSTGSISGESAADSLMSYMGYTALGPDAESVPSFSDVEIGGGHIFATETNDEHPEGIAMGMYHTDQYMPPEGEYTTVTASDGQKIADALADGKLVVAIMLKGHFTSSGHFIVLRGVKDGKILVADPASYDRSSMEWDLSIILNEASTHAGAGGPFWIIG